MPATDTIIKYLKVRALAEQGEGGERANAQRIASQMEEDHPGLKTAARRYVQAAQAANGSSPAGAPSGVWPKAGAARTGQDKNGFSFTGNWDQIFGFAKDVVDTAYDFASTVVDANTGRDLAEEVDSSLRISRAGNLLLTFRMSLWVYQSLPSLNLVQKEAFRQALHERLDEELDEMFGIYREEEEEEEDLYPYG